MQRVIALIESLCATIERVERERDEARIAEKIECKVGQLDRLFIGKGEYVRADEALARVTALEAEKAGLVKIEDVATTALNRIASLQEGNTVNAAYAAMVEIRALRNAAL